MVQELAEDLGRVENFKLWIAEYYSPKLYAGFQSEKFSGSLGSSPFQFFPPDWISFFEHCGWIEKETRYLFDEGEKVGRRFPLPVWGKVLRAFMGSERFARGLRLQAYVVFQRMTIP